MLKFPPVTTCILFIGIVLIPIALGLHYRRQNGKEGLSNPLPTQIGLLLLVAASLVSLFFAQPSFLILTICYVLALLLICWGDSLQKRRQNDPKYKRLK